MNPSAFISYSHDSNDHADRALKLADRLRSEGIDVRLDQYESSPKEGWPMWMDRQISNSDYVVCICSATYYRRVMGKEKAGTGLGVRWEGRQIYQHIYDQGSLNHKFIPIYFSDSSPSQIPIPLKGITHYAVETEEGYEALYLALRGVMKQEKPELGELRSLEPKDRQTDVGAFLTGFIDPILWDQAKWNGTVYMYSTSGDEPPWLGFLFENEDAAAEIFKGWHKRLGEADEYNELRISIIEGDIPGEEKGYTVAITSNVINTYNRAEKQGIELPKPYVFILSRTNRMNPAPDSVNLDTFKEQFNRFGSYFLVPCIKDNRQFVPVSKLRLHKRTINFRNTAEITSKNDPDALVMPQFYNETPER